MPSTNQTFSFQVKGLDCADCAVKLQKGICNLKGVNQCEVSFASEKIHVNGNLEPTDIITHARRLGYDIQLPSSIPPERPARAGNFWQYMLQQSETRYIVAGAFLILPGLILEEIGGMQHWLIDIASVLALAIAGFKTLQKAWASVFLNRSIDIEVLMSIAAIGAVVIGAFTEAGVTMVLFALGEAIEGFTTGRARHAIRSLMEIVPEQATVLSPESGSLFEKRVNNTELKVGDILLVKPGERIPMDGVILRGISSVNQSSITGESQMVKKDAGDEVFASSINGEGLLEIQVTRLVQDNTISKLIQMVEEAQEKRSPIQRFVDRFARIYTPAITAIAFLVIILPPLLFQQPLLNLPNGEQGWLYRGLALLVIGCPCALVISTPVSIISAISNAARNGILIKGGAFLEELSRVQALALDKTGTLTEGRPRIHKLMPAMLPGNGSEQEMLALASAVEQGSEHPLAHAILDEAEQRGIKDLFPGANMVTALVGQGVTGQVQERSVTIASHAYFDEHITHSPEDCENASAYEKQGHTVVMVSHDEKYLGSMAISDTLRQDSQQAVQALQESGLKHIIMLTGDNHATANQVAQQIGITEFKANLLPAQKVAAIENLQKKYRRVAMVGDGINDAPALARANVGIAIGGDAGGTAQAMETADITLMGGDLRQLSFAFRISRAAMRVIRFNILLAIGVKLVFLLLVLLGAGSMWMAVVADVGTTMLVTLIGLQLLHLPKNKFTTTGHTRQSALTSSLG